MSNVAPYYYAVPARKNTCTWFLFPDEPIFLSFEVIFKTMQPNFLLVVASQSCGMAKWHMLSQQLISCVLINLL